MDHSIRISIPRTHSESKNSFLSRYYTVYEIRVTISCTCTMTVFRRYKQFRILNDEIQDIIKRGNLALPSFPQKTFFNNSKVISERKGQFEE